MKTRLFNQYESYNDDANKLANELDEAIRPILKKAALHHPLRDIEVVAMAAMNLLTAEMVVRNSINQSEIDDLNDQKELLGQKVAEIWKNCTLNNLKYINNPQVKDWNELNPSDKETCRKIGEELFEFGKSFRE